MARRCVKQRLALPDPLRASYFGLKVGSPPGLPGGGMTGVFPDSGAGTRISGLVLAGGHKTPSDRASLSLNGSCDCPMVGKVGLPLAEFGGAVGSQRTVAFAAGACGAAGLGGTCASAGPENISTAEKAYEMRAVMKNEPKPPALVPD